MELFSDSKLIHHLPNVEEWRLTHKSKPILLEIDMTNKCDHKCPHCVCAFARDSKQLSAQDANGILVQARDLGIKAVTFTGGGEPLLNANTPDIMEISNNYGLDVGLITNGGLINKESAKKIVKNSKWCRVSLDASNPTLYKLAHGVDQEKWKKVIDGISFLVEQKHILGSNVTLGIGYLVDVYNIDSLEEAIQLSNDLNIDYVQIRPMRDSVLSSDDFLEGIKSTILGSATKVLLSEARFNSMGKFRAYKKCNATNFVITIGADNKVYACCDTKYRADACYGDLSILSLKEIWEGQTRKLKNGVIYDFCPHPCRHDANNIFLEKFSSYSEHNNFV